jgi:hypothetical protein
MRTVSLWRLMFGGLGVGVTMLAGGSSVGSDIGALAAGYGVLVIGAALFLGVGLAVRTRIWHAIGAPRGQSQPLPKTVMGHRVF